jgi:hypothetical protein
MKNPWRLSTLVPVMLVVQSGADPLPGATSQLLQLNRESQQQLREVQRPPPFPLGKPAGSGESDSKQLDRQQQIEQRSLQERQRRDLLWLRDRARRTEGPDAGQRLEAIHQQRQFRLQQQQQLNRFRIQKGSRIR